MDNYCFNHLLQKVHGAIVKKDTAMRLAIPANIRLIVTLRYLATGRSYKDLSYSSRISPQAIGLIVMETCEAIIDALREYIKVSFL